MLGEKEAEEPVWGFLISAAEVQEGQLGLLGREVLRGTNPVLMNSNSSSPWTIIGTGPNETKGLQALDE